MDLKEFMQTTGWTLQKIADKSGYHKSYVSNLVNGKKRPSLDAMEKFAEITRGAVMPNDWMEL